MQERTAGSRHLLTVEELASVLSVPKSWVYARTASGGIPHYRVGRYVRFRLGEVLSWLEADRGC
ncbi:MAG: helix-turn-helix domain-containing protein [Coriobacteriia bacterium]|nr:helix-turn-helix domain-containing protein [Coriobacteriia bacterium]